VHQPPAVRDEMDSARPTVIKESWLEGRMLGSRRRGIASESLLLAALRAADELSAISRASNFFDRREYPLLGIDAISIGRGRQCPGGALVQEWDDSGPEAGF